MKPVHITSQACKPAITRSLSRFLGFQTQTLTNFALGLSQQVRQNFTLQVAAVGTTVEVSAAADTALSTTSSSVGTVLPEFQLRELPTGDRNVMELLRGVGGTGPTEGVIDGFFGGNRTSAVNVTRDGFTVGAGRYDQGTFATAYTSSRPCRRSKDHNRYCGRGGRSRIWTGSDGHAVWNKQFRGSAFWNNRNSLFDARDWFANFNRTSADWENRNQFGARLGGPSSRTKRSSSSSSMNNGLCGKRTSSELCIRPMRATESSAFFQAQTAGTPSKRVRPSICRETRFVLLRRRGRCNR